MGPAIRVISYETISIDSVMIGFDLYKDLSIKNFKGQIPARKISGYCFIESKNSCRQTPTTSRVFYDDDDSRHAKMARFLPVATLWTLENEVPTDHDSLLSITCRGA